MNPYPTVLKEGVLPLGQAFSDAGIVILVVFGVLLIMYILISLSGKILSSLFGEKKEASGAAPSANAVPAASEDTPSGASGEEFSSGTLKLKGCDEKTAAMIMAIVSDNTGIPLSELVFKSITLVEEN